MLTCLSTQDRQGGWKLCCCKLTSLHKVIKQHLRQRRLPHSRQPTQDEQTDRASLVHPVDVSWIKKVDYIMK